MTRPALTAGDQGLPEYPPLEFSGVPSSPHSFPVWGRGIVEDMCYEIRRVEACVDEADHHTLVNAGEKASV